MIIVVNRIFFSSSSSLFVTVITLERCFYSGSIASSLFFFIVSMGACVFLSSKYLLDKYSLKAYKSMLMIHLSVFPLLYTLILYFSFCFLLFSFLSFHSVAYNFYLLHCHFFGVFVLYFVAWCDATFCSVRSSVRRCRYTFFFGWPFFPAVDYSAVEINERQPNKWMKTLLTVTR